MIVNASSNLETRWSNGSPKARNSTSFQPQPRPSTSLPPESSCVAAAIRASTPGGWNAVHATSGPSSMRSVIPASQASVVQASHGPRSGVAVQQMVADPERVEPHLLRCPRHRRDLVAARYVLHLGQLDPDLHRPERLERRRVGRDRDDPLPDPVGMVDQEHLVDVELTSLAPALRAVDGNRMRVVAEHPLATWTGTCRL